MALKFADNDFVTFAPSGRLFGSIEHTIFVMARTPVSVTANQVPFAVADDDESPYTRLIWFGGDDLWYRCLGGTALVTVNLPTTSMTKPRWHGCAGVRRSATYHEAWVDGFYVMNNTSTDTGDVDPDLVTHATLGARNQNGSRAEAFTGDIARAAVWNVALTHEELMAVTLGVSPMLIRPQNLTFCPDLNNLNFYDPISRTTGTTDSGNVALLHDQTAPFLDRPAKPFFFLPPRTPVVHDFAHGGLYGAKIVGRKV